MSRSHWPLIGLGVLTAITVLLVVQAFLHVRPPAGAVATSPTQSREESTPPETPTTIPAPAARDSTIEGIQSLFASSDTVKVVVLGDGTGADNPPRGEERWVTTWAQELSRDKRVQLSAMDDSGAYGPPRTLGSARETIEIRNSSDHPGKLSDVLPVLETRVPMDTDLVVLNFGHNEDAARVTADLDAVSAQLPPGAMRLVILQNPESGPGAQGQRERTRVVGSWAQETATPTIDVFAAFTNAPEPLADLLIEDRVNPSDEGVAVWVGAIEDQLG